MPAHESDLQARKCQHPELQLATRLSACMPPATSLSSKIHPELVELTRSAWYLCTRYQHRRHTSCVQHHRHLAPMIFGSADKLNQHRQTRFVRGPCVSRSRELCHQSNASSHAGILLMVKQEPHSVGARSHAHRKQQFLPRPSHLGAPSERETEQLHTVKVAIATLY